MQLLAVVALGASSAYAIKTVSAPATVTAGVEFPMSIAFDFDQGEYSIDKQWQNYRVYLSDDEGYYGINWPMCYLSDVLPLSEQPPAIIVPKEAGPPGSTYHLYVFTFNGSYFEDGGQEAGLDFSDAFQLEDTDVQAYSPQEWDGPKREYDSIPCSAMQCNRKCKESFFATSTAAFWTFTDYCKCLAECPGVTTGHPNSLEGCSFEWGYLRTAGSERPSTTQITQDSTITGESDSAFSKTSTTDTRQSLGTAATITFNPAAVATGTASSSSTTGGAARAIATGKAYAALALVAFLR